MHKYLISLKGRDGCLEEQNILEKSINEKCDFSNNVNSETVQYNENKIFNGQFKEIFKTIFDNTAVAITVTDENERIISWNAYTEHLLGLNKEDLYLKQVESLYPPEEWQKIRSENIRQRGMQHHLETRMLRKGNQPFDVDISLSVLKNNEGNILGSIGVIRDITKRKEAEKEIFEKNCQLEINSKELKRLNNELTEAQERLLILNQGLEKQVKIRTKEIENLLYQKENFIGQLSHDLNTPLTPIVGLIPIVKEKVQDKNIQDMLETIFNNIKVLSNLVNKTFELMKLNSTNSDFIFQDVNLFTIIEKSLSNFEPIIQKNNIYIANNVNENIFVTADRTRLQQLLNNLISNSVKFISHSDDKIIIDAETIGDDIKISIKDNGIGIGYEHLPLIFNEFFKGDDSRHNLYNHGLGLSICKRIVEKHGGKIWAESQGIGMGTKLIFTIPKGKENTNKM